MSTTAPRRAVPIPTPPPQTRAPRTPPKATPDPDNVLTEITARVEMRPLVESLENAVGLRSALKRSEEIRERLEALLSLERSKSHRLYATMKDLEKQCDQYRAMAESALGQMEGEAVVGKATVVSKSSGSFERMP